MEDVIDTSDAEEKEAIEAERPGYYDRVWGMPENGAIETTGRSGAHNPVTFVHLQPRTPSPKKLQAAVNFDPSLKLDRLQISLDSHSPDSPSRMLLTSPIVSVSHPQTIWRPPDSDISSSPDLGGFDSEISQHLNQSIDQDPLVDFIEIAQNASSLLTQRGSQTPPLGFPSSPPSHLTSLSPPDVLSESIGNSECLPGPVDPQNNLFRVYSVTPLTPSPPTYSPSSHTPPGSILNSLPSQPFPVTVPLDNEPQHRKYSFRHRSAKQLNPFQYDKRQYKRQLRDMPEAIVKDLNLGGGRASQKERYREEGENDWEQEGVADAEGDGDEEWRAREKRRERQLQHEALKARMRDFGINLESPEEDEILLDIGISSKQQAGENMRGKKRKRAMTMHAFPMVAELKNTPKRQASPSVPKAMSPSHPSPQPRPRPNNYRPSHIFPQPVRAPGGSLDAQIDVDCGIVGDSGDDVTDDPWVIQNQEKRAGLPRERHADQRISPSLVESSENGIRRSSRKGRLKRPALDADASDVQSLEAADRGPEGAKSDEESRKSQESEVELTGKLRKQLKALNRMMPGVMRNKVLANAEIKDKPRTTERSGCEISDHENLLLQPGRGRKRIVSPSSRDPKRYEIKGDTESETSSSGSVRISDPEVIIVDDDGEEEDAEQALEVSDDGLNEEDIQSWLAPELQEEKVSHEAARKRRPEAERDMPRGGDLIDRMLQRTKRVGPRKPQPTTSNHRPKIPGPRKPAIDIVTREAKRLCARGRQTKLAFPKVDGGGRSSSGNGQEVSVGSMVSSREENQEHRTNAQDDKTMTKKTKKKNRGAVQSKLFILQRDGYKTTTGRPRQIIHIDDDDDAFHDVLAPADSVSTRRALLHQDAKVRRSRPDNIREKFRRGIGTESDAFDVDMTGLGPRQSKISLDFDLVLLPSGLTLGSDSYIGKGRLYDLISLLKGEMDPPSPFSVTLFRLQIDPNMPMTQISTTLASACDKLYDVSTMATDDVEVTMNVKAADALMHTLCQIVAFKALHMNEEEERLLVTIVSEQINHLIARINDRIELISADGHSMDYRSFILHWFAVEMHLRLVYAHQKRVRPIEANISSISHAADQYCVQLLRRLLEYGLERTIGLLQNGRFQDTVPSNIRVLELWICVFHIAPFLTSLPLSEASKPTNPFWRVVEAALDAQSNKPDSQLYESERMWRTIFSLCTVSQFTLEGFSTSTPRLEAHWPIVKNALKSIRLSADVRDNSKPASTLHKRDTYLRLVTARCFLLCIRWNWRLNDADDMFQELCAIFRSRQFSNLLGEPDDFPVFIRQGNEGSLNIYQKDDTAFGLFLKLTVRASMDFLKTDVPSRLRSVKLIRLLNLAVPVGCPAFTKDDPPTSQGLSMLYNRYSAIFVAIYVDSSVTNIRSRLQQARRYTAFKDADPDSQAAAIRSMMHIAILLRHLNRPLDEVLVWASEMMDDLIAELTSGQAEGGDSAQERRNELVFLVHVLLRSIRNIIETPTLNNASDLPPKFPDIGLLQAWMPIIISSPLAKDHRTGLEICECTQSFLIARQAVIPFQSIPKSAAGHDNQESQDEYGDGGLDLSDPTLLAFLDDIEDRPDENGIVDHNASNILDACSQPLYTCVCMHLGCTMAGSPYKEADQWLECWLGCGSVLVRNKKRVWDYYFQLGESAWQDISDFSRLSHLRLRFMLTVMKLDPRIYKSHGNQILTLWFECIISPNVALEHQFTARLFSIDGLRHALFKNIPCVADIETGYFAFSVDEFRGLRLPIIEVVLSNVSAALSLGLDLYIPRVKTLLETARKWIDVMDRNVARVEYIEFVRKIVVAIHNHYGLTGHPCLQNSLTWGGSL